MRTDFDDDNSDIRLGAAEHSMAASLGPQVDNTTLAPVLHWWRTLPAHAWTEPHLGALAETLSVFSILGEPRWRAAVAGDPEAAVCVALRVTMPGNVSSTVIDIIMSALVWPAFGGNAGAVLVMASIIKRVVAGAEGKWLASSWLERSRKIPDKPRLPAQMINSESEDVHR